MRTTCITIACGIGHVLSSVVLGIIGIALGISLNKLGAIESFRGGLAAWLLIAFGLGYFIWGVFRARKNLPHKHKHSKDQLHILKDEKAKNLTPWILFAIFVFGPCEPLIPLLIYPAAKSSTFGLVLVTGIFGVVTIATILSIVILLSLGANLLPMGRLERYTHALSGATICICGIAIRFLGL